jgi:adenylate cyclase/guanylate cyclase
LDRVRVKGRTQALKIFELLELAEQKSPLPDTVMTDYAEGLAHWRAGAFDLAAKCFTRSAGADRPSANFLVRAREMENLRPGTDWDPVRALQEK